MLGPRRFLLLALLGAALFPAAVAASVSPGARLAYVEWQPAPPMTRLVTVAAGGGERRLVPLEGVRPVPYAGPAWSADGTTLYFAGYRVDARGEARDGARTWLYSVGSEGGIPRRLAGTAAAGSPVLSPDGTTLAFERLRVSYRYDPRRPLASGVSIRSSAWSVPVAGGLPRQLTSWRRGLTVRPAAYSPDGSTLLLERDRGPAWSPEVVALERGRALRVVLSEAEQPSYSPDGAWIVLVSYRDGQVGRGPSGLEPVGELYVVDSDGSRARRLTRTPRQQESQPAWGPGGTRIAYLRARGPAGLGRGTELRTVAPDGSCGSRLAGARGQRSPLLYGPAWQPGLGREPGPISC